VADSLTLAPPPRSSAHVSFTSARLTKALNPDNPNTALTPCSPDRIFIVGAGGFGREVLEWALAAWPNHAAKIQGFLSDDDVHQTRSAVSLPIVGAPRSFSPDAKDAFLLAIGIPVVRRSIAENMRARGARFMSLVHPTALVSETAIVEEGSIICPYAIVSADTRVGSFTLMNYHSSLGHDASTGSYCVLSPYATIGGGGRIGDDVFMGMHASVGPGKTVGSLSKISANSAALAHVPPKSLVYGVPGRVAPLVSEAGHQPSPPLGPEHMP